MDKEITTPVLRFGAVTSILAGITLYVIGRWVPTVGEWLVVGGYFVAGILMAVGGVLTDRRQYGAIGFLNLAAVAVVVAIAPSATDPLIAVFLVAIGLVELLLAPAYSQIADYGESVGKRFG